MPNFGFRLQNISPSKHSPSPSPSSPTQPTSNSYFSISSLPQPKNTKQEVQRSLVRTLMRYNWVDADECTRQLGDAASCASCIWATPKYIAGLPRQGRNRRSIPYRTYFFSIYNHPFCQGLTSWDPTSANDHVFQELEQTIFVSSHVLDGSDTVADRSLKSFFDGKSDEDLDYFIKGYVCGVILMQLSAMWSELSNTVGLNSGAINRRLFDLWIPELGRRIQHLDMLMRFKSSGHAQGTVSIQSKAIIAGECWVWHFCLCLRDSILQLAKHAERAIEDFQLGNLPWQHGIGNPSSYHLLYFQRLVSPLPLHLLDMDSKTRDGIFSQGRLDRLRACRRGWKQETLFV